MRSRPLTGLVLALALTPVAQAADPHLATDLEKVSYSIGLQLGQNLARQGLSEIDSASLAVGIQDALAGSPPRLTAEQMQTAQEGYRKALVEQQRALAEKNLASGKSFMIANAKREGVVTLDSGVQYRVLKSVGGDTKPPALDENIIVNYKGMLLDGREFDSSFTRNEPLAITLGGVIAGWQHVVSRMQPGESVETWIPPEHGYGPRGSGPLIGPNATLHFQIDLLEIKGRK